MLYSPSTRMVYIVSAPEVPEKPGHVVVPHPRKDMAIGTLRNIYRQAGWEWR